MLMKEGNSYFWLNNWTGLCTLCQIIPPNFECDHTNILVKETAERGQWQENTLRRILPQGLAGHILEKVDPPKEGEELDRAYSKLEARGKLTVVSAFQAMRQKRGSQ